MRERPADVPEAALIALVVVLAVALAVAVVALALLADRLAAATAERRASELLSGPLGPSALVRVSGRPFAPQALRGRYPEVRVTTGGMRVGELTGVTLDARLTTVYLSSRELLAGRAGELACDRVEGTLVLPYGELARVAPIQGLELTLRGDRLYASASVPIPGISQLARVSGEAGWSVAAAGTVRLRIQGVSVAGIAVPAIVLGQLLPTMDVAIPLPDLPYGLRIDRLAPTADGLAVSGSADATVIRKVVAPS